MVEIGITLFVVIVLFIIVEGVENHHIKKILTLQKLLREKDKENELLYKVFAQVYNELSLLKLKDCPEEEFKNIPLELCNWLEELAGIKEETSCQEQEKDL